MQTLFNNASLVQSYFPGMVHVVYVIRPAGFFQKAISEVSSKFFKEEFKFRLMVCATLDDLFAHVERSQVTQDLGGELMYSHHEWIQQRIVSIPSPTHFSFSLSPSAFSLCYPLATV